MAIRSRNKVELSFSMSSMTDIVFLLLIFFIILSTLVSPFGAKVDLPSGKARIKDIPKMNLTVTSDLNYQLDGQSVTRNQLERIFSERQNEENKPSIILNVDKSIPTGETVSILSLAKEYGFGIVIATKPK